MSEKEITYAELQLPYSKKQKDERYPTHKRREFPWQIIAVILGITCIFLLLATTILAYKFFQIRSKHKTQHMIDTQKNISSPEVEDPTDHSVLPPRTDNDCNTCQEKWSCCGEKCYYFSTEGKTWSESEKSCQDLHSSLIKIDNKEEQISIQTKIKYNYWVGLHRNGANHPWLWQDDSKLSRQLTFRSSGADGNCGHLKRTYITAADCAKLFYFICEKKGPNFDSFIVQ